MGRCEILHQPSGESDVAGPSKVRTEGSGNVPGPGADLAPHGAELGAADPGGWLLLAAGDGDGELRWVLKDVRETLEDSTSRDLERGFCVLNLEDLHLSGNS